MSGALVTLPDASAKPPRPASDSPSTRELRVRLTVAAAMILVLTGFVLIRLLYPFNFISHSASGSLLHWLLPRFRKEVSGWSMASLLLYPFGLLTIFALERLFPAVPTQKTLSTGLVHDALWELMTAATGLVMAKWYISLLHSIYTRHLSFLTLPAAAMLPLAVRVVLGVLATDLLKWFQHWVHHRVPCIWAFHSLHHSQREINLFTAFRIHFVEHYITQTFLVLPLLMLGLQSPLVLWWVLINAWHARLEHANIKTDCGFLRYIFVTPQSHRMHHSKYSQHFDCNFGAMLSIWDFLFGTQCRRFDLYPESGIDDENFPGESAASVRGVLTSVVHETVYPFKIVWMMIRRQFAGVPVAAAGESRGIETQTSLQQNTAA